MRSLNGASLQASICGNPRLPGARLEPEPAARSRRAPANLQLRQPALHLREAGPRGRVGRGAALHERAQRGGRAWRGRQPRAAHSHLDDDLRRAAPRAASAHGRRAGAARAASAGGTAAPRGTRAGLPA
jgi:hypothetical protein